MATLYLLRYGTKVDRENQRLVMSFPTNSKQLLLRLNRKRKDQEVEKAIGGIAAAFSFRLRNRQPPKEQGAGSSERPAPLMEEFRSPVVDSFVLKYINNCSVKPEDFDFVQDTGGVYLNKQAKKPFLQHFERRMNEMVSHRDLQSQVTYRQAIQLQIRRYKDHLLQGIAYEPFIRPA